MPRRIAMLRKRGMPVPRHTQKRPGGHHAHQVRVAVRGIAPQAHPAGRRLLGHPRMPARPLARVERSARGAVHDSDCERGNCCPLFSAHLADCHMPNRISACATRPSLEVSQRLGMEGRGRGDVPCGWRCAQCHPYNAPDVAQNAPPPRDVHLRPPHTTKGDALTSTPQAPCHLCPHAISVGACARKIVRHRALIAATLHGTVWALHDVVGRQRVSHAKAIETTTRNKVLSAVADAWTTAHETCERRRYRRSQPRRQAIRMGAHHSPSTVPRWHMRSVLWRCPPRLLATCGHTVRDAAKPGLRTAIAGVQGSLSAHLALRGCSGSQHLL